MTRREFGNPIVRFAARGSVSWSYVAPIAVVIAVTVFLLPTIAAMTSSSLLNAAGIFCLLYGTTHAANRIIEWDRDGRLDQVRLAGHPPTTLLWSLSLGSSGPFLALAAVLLVPAMRQFDANDFLALALLWAAVGTLSFLALALPRGRAIDARLVAVGLATVTITISLAVGGVLAAHGELLVLLAQIVGVRTLTLVSGAVVVFAVLAGFAVRRVMLAMARPQPSTTAQELLLSGAPYGRGPSVEFWRAIRLMSRSAMFVGLLASVAVLVNRAFFSNQTQPGASSTSSFSELVILIATIVLPLFASAFIVSSTNRADRDSGRFEVMRLTPMRTPRVVLPLLAGQWLPFVLAATLVIAVVELSWDPVAPQVPDGGDQWRMPLSICVFLFSAAPLPALEGWYRRWPFVYSIPAGLMFFVLVGPSWGALARQSALAWIPWFAVGRVWRVPETPPLAGVAGIFAVCSVAFAVLWPVLTAQYLFNAAEQLAQFGALLLLMLPLISSSTSLRWAPGVAAAFATMTLMAIAPLRFVDAAILALVPLGAWWAGLRLHQLTKGGAWSAPLRALMAATLMAMAMAFVHQILFFLDPVPQAAASRGDPAIRQAVTTWIHGVLAALTLGAVLLIEIVHRWTLRRR